MKKTTSRLLIIFFTIIQTACVYAQMITDGSVGSVGKTVLQGPAYNILAEYGKLSGKNLFHSFQEFNIGSGKSATFHGPDSVRNIITRVTGGNPSKIDGILALDTDIWNANFYLLNSAGVMFGSGAELHLGGSFHVSTADYLRLKDDERFYAMPQENEVLSVDDPTAFGFLDSDIARIRLEGAGDLTEAEVGTAYFANKLWYPLGDNPYPSGSLRISEGETVSVIGGDIEISRGTFFKAMVADDAGNEKPENIPLGEIRAPGGRINLAAVGSAGEVVLEDDDLDVSSFQELGNIRLSEKSLLNVAGMQGGNIFIRGGDFFMDDSAIYGYALNDAGILSIKTENLSLTSGSLIASQSYGFGNGGNIDIRASETVTLSGVDSEDGSPTRIETFSHQGDGGSVTIESKSILLNDGAQINSSALPPPDEFLSIYGDDHRGKGGDIFISASESVMFSGTDAEEGNYSGIKSFASFGDGGDVTIESKNIFLNDGAQINTASLDTGNAGNISISTENLTLSDGASLFAEAENAGGGNIAIGAEKRVRLSDGKMTTSVQSGEENAGDITIAHPEFISVQSGKDNTGDISIARPEFVTLNHSQIKAEADRGDGGAIFIHADQYLQSSDSLLDASSERGNDGSVKIEAPDTNITGYLGLLPSAFLPDIPLDSCPERIGKNAASFIIAGPDGIPSPHDAFLASPPMIPDLPEAEALCRKGDFQDAVPLLEQALSISDRESEAYLHTLLYLSHARKATGQYRKAFSALHELLPVMERCDAADRKALFFSEFGDVSLSMGETGNAEEYLEKGVDAARLSDDSHVLGFALNNLGNFFAADGDRYGAISAYKESLGLAQEPSLKSAILLNMLRLGIRKEREREETADQAWHHIHKLPDSYEKASYLMSLGLLFSESGQDREKVYALLDGARQIAESLGNSRIASYAYGYMGSLYGDEARHDEAIRLTRRAVFHAQKSRSPEILYRWQWQLGRLFRAAKDFENALDAYRQAKETLDPIRSGFFKGYRNKKEIFYEKIKPVYAELAELLLEQYAMTEDEKVREEKLREVRDTMESLKIAELQDFFRDECLRTMRKEIPPVNRAQDRTALIYPVSLSDHLALLLILPDGMKAITVSADPKEVRKWAERFRSRLQNPSKMERQILFYAQPLYDWLIRPLESDLSERDIDTLVIVPDAALRLIPFSALHDGEKFLVEKYAIATVPAITLTDTANIGQENIRLLFNGLSEKASPPLPGVKALSENIREIMGRGTFLLDSAFTLDNLRREFGSTAYSSVIMATHGIFGGSPRETYLQTSDGRLTMDDLESLIRSGSIQGRNPDLLTLHACQTAMGDERAALGLGGIVVKAGVRSALATLWSVTDRSAAFAVTEFYRQLSTGMSKAKALQAAQKMMITEGPYRHPAYWAPFLLIGNWE